MRAVITEDEHCNCYRFYDHLPLYDVLNQFQKGHSHMGVVVRSKQGLKDMSDATFNSATSAVKASVIRIPEQSGKKGILRISDVLMMLMYEKFCCSSRLCRDNSHLKLYTQFHRDKSSVS